MIIGDGTSESVEGDGKAVPGKRKCGKTELAGASDVDVELNSVFTTIQLEIKESDMIGDTTDACSRGHFGNVIQCYRAKVALKF
ncbi:unnamed protein product [Cylicostephanus goldi]|uniref:Uncharacterized protein n=1 Tax=Cylicostephanus goldi TaxID=71465 RepID=A0A3P6R1P6_CYLGO|nr:unnamed protein product [Cylicostephanus goldi]